MRSSCVVLLQFGKGIYFADMSSKSANYCYATRMKNVGLVLLSEVGVCVYYQAHSQEFQRGSHSFIQIPFWDKYTVQTPTTYHSPKLKWWVWITACGEL